MKNNFRFDLSDHLIHFFRDVDQQGESSILFPEHMGWHNVYEDTQLPANFLLRAALRNGRLWATWSYRDGKRTIFGPNPAVCFTEMPIAAFLETARIRRANGEAMSPFAMVFPKETLHRLGARPVTYGLSDNAVPPPGNNGGPRIFNESTLPLNEQFRYVSHVYGSTKTVDWTHEREWRWPYRGDCDSVDAGGEGYDGSVSDWYDIPGLDFYRYPIKGMGVIVETTSQAKKVVSDMLTLIDNGTASKSTFGFVLVSNHFPSPSVLQDPTRLSDAVNEAVVSLEPYFAMSTDECDEYEKRFAKLVAEVERNADPASDGEFGGCWLWLHDNRAPLTRALLRSGRAFVTKEGRYLANLHEFWDARGLREREEMAEQVSKLVLKEFGTPSCHFSVLDSDNPEAVPFYVGMFDDDISFYNCSWQS
ncbi:DUF4427 domain-containing protein [Burkholderia sp. HI2500]|uniref:DUF4427 domain-containing protein n=1 Tax=Burkholderia sp. HI2500 TaxID=2015358 RepID=UPI00117EBD61|nr:DUF4427 domain-containing protein [Burkholderia sp. HI2500]